MALKVKAREKLQKIGAFAGEYRYVMMPELYTPLSQEKVIKEAALRPLSEPQCPFDRHLLRRGARHPRSTRRYPHGRAEGDDATVARRPPQALPPRPNRRASGSESRSRLSVLRCGESVRRPTAQINDKTSCWGQKPARGFLRFVPVPRIKF